MGYKDLISGGSFGFQLKAITVAACVPSTHDEMVENAIRLTNLLNPTLKRTDIPRLHYAKIKGGLDSRFRQGKIMYPGRFAERTGLLGLSLRCAEHTIQYSQCDAECRVGVYDGTRWMYEHTKKGSKGRKETSKSDAKALPVSDIAKRLEKILA